ncbi:hypothetical protein MKZ38_001078 [Zalerion maritima]|uniref:Uncharacterized protein n=1 Tax=Zalerion maritima TaxID=339359 RepID=A0AAD5RRV4_9PEZI|nr:hypothetical protein MKZ38_001078 [Zalerion maritima]
MSSTQSHHQVNATTGLTEGPPSRITRPLNHPSVKKVSEHREAQKQKVRQVLDIEAAGIRGEARRRQRLVQPQQQQIPARAISESLGILMTQEIASVRARYEALERGVAAASTVPFTTPPILVLRDTTAVGKKGSAIMQKCRDWDMDNNIRAGTISLHHTRRELLALECQQERDLLQHRPQQPHRQQCSSSGAPSVPRPVLILRLRPGTETQTQPGSGRREVSSLSDTPTAAEAARTTKATPATLTPASPAPAAPSTPSPTTTDILGLVALANGTKVLRSIVLPLDMKICKVHVKAKSTEDREFYSEKMKDAGAYRRRTMMDLFLLIFLLVLSTPSYHAVALTPSTFLSSLGTSSFYCFSGRRPFTLSFRHEGKPRPQYPESSPAPPQRPDERRRVPKQS